MASQYSQGFQNLDDEGYFCTNLKFFKGKYFQDYRSLGVGKKFKRVMSLFSKFA